MIDPILGTSNISARSFFSPVSDRDLGRIPLEAQSRLSTTADDIASCVGVSAVVVGELFKGAYGSADATRHLRNIEARVLPAMTVLPYDVQVARVYGAFRAQLEATGNPGDRLEF
jgi:predicted nucleic acid-binding protein